MTTWVTADTHFGHANIIKHCSRPFKSVDEMDDALIENWNSVVKPSDTVYHLGDFAYRNKHKIWQYTSRLHGSKLLIIGNHDEIDDNSVAFASISWYQEINVDGIKVVLFHWPIENWQGWYHGSIHLHGHCHGTLTRKVPGRYDVGVDCNNFTPINLEELVIRLGAERNNE